MTIFKQSIGYSSVEESKLDNIYNIDELNLELKMDILNEACLKKNDFSNCNFWGIVMNNKNKNSWEKIDLGDIVLFSSNRTIVRVGRICMKIQSEKLAEKIWGVNDDSKTWSLIYGIDTLIEENIHMDDFNKMIGYGQGANFMGFDMISKNELKDDAIILGLALNKYKNLRREL